VTDGLTDGQNYDSQDRASIAASRGKNGLVEVSVDFFRPLSRVVQNYCCQYVTTMMNIVHLYCGLQLCTASRRAAGDD